MASTRPRPTSHAPPEPFDIQASTIIPAAPEAVFAFLADLENHWLIADRFVDVLQLSGPPGARHGGRVRIRGPLGLRRTATTRVDFSSPVEELRGVAQLGGTSAHVHWLLRPGGGASAVTLAARIHRATPLDRLLLAAGGLSWMRRRFRGSLRALAERFGEDGTPQPG